MRLKRMLSACMRLACVLFLVLNVMGDGPPTGVPTETVFARVPDPAPAVRMVGETVEVSSGSQQSAQINTDFPSVLVARVSDYTSSPVAETTVTFRAPTDSGVPSGTFAGGLTTVEALSDVNGLATSPIFTANGISGGYQVRATVSGGATEATFDLVNQLPPTVTPTATSTNTPTATPTNTSTPTPVSTVPTATPPLPTPVSEGRPGESAVTGSAGEGSPPLVTVQQKANGSVILQFYAYPITFLGGVRVAMADMNDDGTPDIITAPGPGMQALIRVFDGRNGRLIREFLAFPSSFQGGTWVATGDLDGDGRNEIVIGAGPGGGTVVRVFHGQTGEFIREITDFTGEIAPDEESGDARAMPPLLAGAIQVKNASASTGGVHVAVGDLDGDGVGEIIADFVASESGVSAANSNQFLALMLLSSYGGRTTRCRAPNDSLLPLLFLSGFNLASGDIGGNGYDSTFMGADGGSGIFQLSLLTDNNRRRCRRRRTPFSVPGGYFGIDAQADQSFTRPAVGTDGQGNAVLYGGASDAGPASYVVYGSDSSPSSSNASGRTTRAVGPGGTYIAAVAPRTAQANSANVSRRDEDSPRRLTETERRQKERTNRLGMDDDRTEGNVVSVGKDERGPFAIIANRDGLVTVLLQCDGGCPKVQEGQYLEADGVKEHEQLFTAYDITVTSVR